jgi:hypothetical protein
MFAAEVRHRAADDARIGTAAQGKRQVRGSGQAQITDIDDWKWQEWRDSNPQPPVLETGALAIELHS